MAYGIQPGQYGWQTPTRSFKKGEPAEVWIGSLKPDTGYHYQFRWQPAGAASFTAGPDCSFHTQRPPGSPFTFTVQADSHLDDRADLALYRQTLANVLADRPDFHIDLGDTFMTEKHASRFIHHLVGGLDKQSRGGIEAAPFYEWGGGNADGTDGFADHRPGWLAPVHQLFVQSKVSIVFHGHDHLYARQDLDGTVYQCVPQTASPRGGAGRAAEYGYASGVILDGCGYVRIWVSPDAATVEYVRSRLASGGTKQGAGASNGYSYTVTIPRAAGGS